MTSRKQIFSILAGAIVSLFGNLAVAQPVSDTSFTYQGLLEQSGIAVTQQCDFEFSLWTGNAAPDPGVKIGSEIELITDVNEGIFTAELDFGADALNGTARWLHIAVCCPSSCAPEYTDLLPRQAITSAPYSVQTRGIYVDESMRVGIGTTSPNAMLTVGSGNGAAIQVGQQPQLHMSKDTVDNKFRMQLTGSGYGSYGLQIGRDNLAHPILLSGHVGVLRTLGIGLESAGPETMVHSRVTTDDFGILVDAEGEAGSRIGLHTGPLGYSSLAKNAYYDGGWRRFNTNFGAYLQEITPFGDVNMSTAPGGGLAISWNTAMTLEASGQVGIGTFAPEKKLHVVGDTRLEGPVHVTGDLTVVGPVTMGYQVVQNVCNDSFCSVNCPAGKKAVGGGCSSLFDELRASTVLDGGVGWHCDYSGGDGVNVRAICVNIE